MAKNPTPSLLDSGQIIKRAFDEANDRIRVDASIQASIGSVSIEDSNGNELDVNPDGSINVNLTNSALQIEISAADGDNVAISDGTNDLTVNPDGSINVVTTLPTIDPVNVYNEVVNVVSGITTDILTLTAVADSVVSLVSVSGTNIAEYTVEINNALKKKCRTYFGSPLNLDLGFGDGLKLDNGDVLKVRVIHQRTDLGDFNATVSYREM